VFKVRLKYAIAEFDGTLYEVGTRVSHSNEEEEILEKPAYVFRGEASEAQKDWRQRFKLAQAYATAVLADTEIRALYEAMGRQQGKSVRGMAVSDYLNGNDLLAKK
jgi:uncharacterized protein with von Willebrand factor type A (vWA) domain